MNSGNIRKDAWWSNEHISDVDMWKAYDACSKLRTWQLGVAEIKKRHGITVSRSAYYRWNDWCRENILEHRLHNAVRFESETLEMVRAAGGDVPKAVEDGVGALAIDAAATGKLSDLSKLVAALVKVRNSTTARERQQDATRTSREKAVGSLLEEAKGNAVAQELLKQFLAALTP